MVSRAFDDFVGLACLCGVVVAAYPQVMMIVRGVVGL